MTSKSPTLSRPWKLEQERPRLNKIVQSPGRFRSSGRVPSYVEHGARALFRLWQPCVLPNGRGRYQLNTSGLRPQVLSAHHLSRGQGQISVNPASVYVLSGCGPHLSRTSQRPPGSGAHCPSNLWFQSARVSFASECVPKRKSSRYGLGVSNKRKSLPFSASVFDLSFSKSYEGKLHQATNEEVI